MKEYIVKKKIAIRATPEAVWDALTNPEKTKKYFFKCEVHSNWKPGNPITFKGTFLFFFKFELKGKIIEAEPGKLLKYSLKNSKTSGESIVTDTLTYEKGVTTVSITDDVGPEDGSEKRYTRSVKGWDKILKGLKEVVEHEL
ncbi:SRPBCC domain-containing protein [Flavobacterium wongokense]|uniref:SRPBCC domain-containing protein n=1 Tax=Flavobacterium wongokense TaxID=2910674 RepID=UPI001F35EBE9|nr:SRPBCC domain-containing protein [Flavobacterium sp. WG47]MCF6130713.1 SRPBCC domain-containing protein [Flavobacterium sp. WG47]